MRESAIKQENNNSTTYKKSKENATLYFFQGIACILVVLIHIPFPGTVGTFFVSLARFAVPLFYMISGYTLYRYIEGNKYKSKVADRIKKNSIVTGTALLAYLFVDIAKCILQHESISEYLSDMVEIENILLFLIVGIIPISSGKVLWFIYGLVYVYVIMYVIPPQKKHVYRNAVISSVIMVLFSMAKVIFTAYPVTLAGINLSEYWIYGNWAVIGFTSVTIGIAIAKFVEEYPEKIKTLCFYSPIIGFLCIVINFIVCFKLDLKYGMYLSYTIFTLILDLLIFVISANDFMSHGNPIVIFGKKHSRNVYLWHPIFVSLTNYAVILLKLQNTWLEAWIQPFTVIVATIIFSIILNKMSSLVNKLLKRKNEGVNKHGKMEF